MSLLLFSCDYSENKKIAHMVSYWQNHEIIYPKDTAFISYSKKWGEQKMYLKKENYTFFCYVDSIGCMSCKLQLPKWKEFIRVVDSVSHGTVPFVFVFQSKKSDDLIHFLRKTGFDYPLFIDVNNSFDKLNHFPKEMQLQTFLLDYDNKVVAIGNPIYNPKVKELYLKIIQGEKKIKEENIAETKVKVGEQSISLGSFDWQKEQRGQFVIQNIGQRPLVIQDVNTSCGCTSVDYSKQPVRCGDSLSLTVVYKAEHPEYFDKTINVYCNTSDSPIRFRITGDAQ